ncbi:MAG: hypothetical protein IJ828_00255 [Treponema sp.]|nr:hypothetical protein [Treponema sp.]
MDEYKEYKKWAITNGYKDIVRQCDHLKKDVLKRIKCDGMDKFFDWRNSTTVFFQNAV